MESLLAHIHKAFAGGYLDPHLTIGGWNMVFAGTFIAVALYSYAIFRASDGASEQRLTLGFSLLMLGAGIRIGGWLPWRAFLYADQPELAEWWRNLSPAWTGIGAIFAIIGLTVMMWPALVRVWSRGALVAVFVGECMLFLFGVMFTKLWAVLWI